MPNIRRLSLRLLATIVLVAIGLLIILLPALVRRQQLRTLGLPSSFTFTDSAAVPAGSPPPDSAAVMTALGNVIDPEIGISIVDLGLVHAVSISPTGDVNVDVALTVAECPAVNQLGILTSEAVIAVHGVRRVNVRLDPKLPWDPGRLSPKARELYRKRFGRP
ncbi:MAG TPA: metal-sulfur cluster assembly factor [bacterium]|nr:metal-sulfur cluster assembly factor [bacterium]